MILPVAHLNLPRPYPHLITYCSSSKCRRLPTSYATLQAGTCHNCHISVSRSIQFWNANTFTIHPSLPPKPSTTGTSLLLQLQLVDTVLGIIPYPTQILDHRHILEDHLFLVQYTYSYPRISRNSRHNKCSSTPAYHIRIRQHFRTRNELPAGRGFPLHTDWQHPQESAWLSKSDLDTFGLDISKSWTISRRNILYD